MPEKFIVRDITNMLYKILIPSIDIHREYIIEALDDWQAVKNIVFEQFPNVDKLDLIKRVERIVVAETYKVISCQNNN